MKKSRYSDSQIISILNQAEAGTPVPKLCRKHGMSNASFYKWRAKYGGMDASLMIRMKELEAENARLKKMYADVQLLDLSRCSIRLRACLNTIRNIEIAAESRGDRESGTRAGCSVYVIDKALF